MLFHSKTSTNKLFHSFDRSLNHSFIQRGLLVGLLGLVMSSLNLYPNLVLGECFDRHYQIAM